MNACRLSCLLAALSLIAPVLHSSQISCLRNDATHSGVDLPMLTNLIKTIPHRYSNSIVWHYSWRNMNKCLFTSDRELMIDQSKDTTKAYLDEPEDYLFQAVLLMWASSRQFMCFVPSRQFGWSKPLLISSVGLRESFSSLDCLYKPGEGGVLYIWPLSMLSWRFCAVYSLRLKEAPLKTSWVLTRFCVGWDASLAF